MRKLERENETGEVRLRERIKLNSGRENAGKEHSKSMEEKRGLTNRRNRPVL